MINIFCQIQQFICDRVSMTLKLYMYNSDQKYYNLLLETITFCIINSNQLYNKFYLLIPLL